MARSKWKIPVVDLSLQENSALKNQFKLKIWKRNNQVLFKNLEKMLLVYDGKEFRKIRSEKEKAGFKFGCFSFTRKYIKKIQNIKKNVKKNAKK